MRKPPKDIKLMSYEEIVGIDNPDTLLNDEEKIMVLPLAQLYDFKDHPFHVTQDEKFLELVESISENGVLEPGIARPREGGGYEVIAGHRRKLASRIANKTDMQFIVRNYTDDEATLIMVDSNIQRDCILPSEKAFAYKMKLEALKHQGKSNSFTGEAADEVGKTAGDSGRQVQRYIRLTHLIPELLDLVDKGRIKLTSAVALSYLQEHEQECVFEVFTEEGGDLSNSNVELLKEHSGTKEFSITMVRLILLEKKSKQSTVTIKPKKLSEYFPSDYGKEEIEEVIFTLLSQWKASQE